ncbi:MAG: VWA domain-containing protein [Flavobacteriales bacterium]|nr:VWA domain-containing protein [Flavobacteriales bacterium]
MIKWRKSAIQNFGDSRLVDQLIPLRSALRNRIKIVLWSIAFVSLIIGLANPQIGSKVQEVKREGIDIMIALDLSNSMLAEDLSPNRLERSKRAIHQFIGELKSDRLGIIVFGGQAYVQLPITTDYAAAKLFLSTINTDIIPTQGTAIGAAIDLAMESFDMESTTNKSIVVISDGENHEDDAVESAKTANELGIIVHTIGVGSPQGAPIPIYRGKQQNGYRKDKDGSTIMTQLNEEMLQEIAMNGDGVYVHATNSQGGLEQILDEINKMEKVEFGTKVFTDYEDRFQYFIGSSIILLLLEQIISSKKSKLFFSKKLFGV